MRGVRPGVRAERGNFEQGYGLPGFALRGAGEVRFSRCNIL